MDGDEFVQKCSITNDKVNSVEETNNLKKKHTTNDSRNSRRKPSNWYHKRNTTDKLQIPCHYYNYGRCAFGDRCRYLHEVHYKNDKNNSITSFGLGENEIFSSAADIDTSMRNNQVVNDAVLVQANRLDSEKKFSQYLHRPVTINPPVIIKREQLGNKEQEDAKQKDISYLKKRFLKSKLRKMENQIFEVEFTYNITEPDWPFDVRSLNCVFLIPMGYPVEKASLRLAEEFLPPTLVIHIEKEMNAFLTSKHEEFERKNSFEPIGRKLIAWLNKSVFDLFIVGLKKTKLVVEAESAGISLVMPSAVSSKDDNKESIDVKDEVITELENDEGLEHCGEICRVKMNDDHLSADDKDLKISTNEKIASTKEGLEVRVNWSNLSGNIASLSTTSLAFQIKCMKCSATGFMTCLENQLTTAYCKQCKNRQSMVFEPKLVHEFSNVIAIVDAKGCRPVDCVLLSSSISFVCLNCNASALTENLSYGAPHKTWCRGCHAKCEFSLLSIRFFGNVRSIALEDSTLKKLEIKKKKKPEQQVIITEGNPLPGNGTCKHYKKSFRWFRFPCCGKVYPCDQCHDEVETEHEMKLANRIICGFCSKEQPFLGNKPCINCKTSVVNKKSAYWEGGKGCRSKLTMSRHDRRKYTNSEQKTVPKKQILQREKQKSRDD